MCGRFMFDPTTNPELKKIQNLAATQGVAVKTGEVFPNDLTALVIDQDQQIKVVAMAWGWPGFKAGQKLINARSETVLQKSRFAQAFLTQRAVYPTNGFFEWTVDKQKVYFKYPNSTQPVYIAGFYAYFDGQPRSILLTTAPNASVAPVHNRMPLLLQKRQISSWLKDSSWAQAFLRQAMPPLQAQGPSTTPKKKK
ncbi:SOS response-associated peptidase family protein [Lactobacillus sp. W8092]|nr:SOS response-associated peptidase family protein [Lactobacillus sp. W8092]